MDIKLLFYKVLLGAMEFALAISLIDVVTLPKSIFSALLCLLFVGAIINLYQKVLSFLAVKDVFLTNFIVAVLMCLLAVYGLTQTSIGFSVGEYTVNTQTLDFIVITQTTLEPWISMVIISMLTGLICAIINSLVRIE